MSLEKNPQKASSGEEKNPTPEAIMAFAAHVIATTEDKDLRDHFEAVLTRWFFQLQQIDPNALPKIMAEAEWHPKDEVYYVNFSRTYQRTGFMVVEAQSRVEAEEIALNILKEDKRIPKLSPDHNLRISSHLEQDQFEFYVEADEVEGIHESQSSVHTTTIAKQYALVQKYLKKHEEISITYDQTNNAWFYSNGFVEGILQVEKNSNGVYEVYEIEEEELEFQMNAINPEELIGKP